MEILLTYFSSLVLSEDRCPSRFIVNPKYFIGVLKQDQGLILNKNS